jgi:hypothetical protein
MDSQQRDAVINQMHLHDQHANRGQSEEQEHQNNRRPSIALSHKQQRNERLARAENDQRKERPVGNGFCIV